MKRLQIYIDEHLDEALAIEAARRGTSKAELIRGFVAAALGRRKERDAIMEIAGSGDYEPGDIDEVVYG